MAQITEIIRETPFGTQVVLTCGCKTFATPGVTVQVGDEMKCGKCRDAASQAADLDAARTIARKHGVTFDSRLGYVGR